LLLQPKLTYPFRVHLTTINKLWLLYLHYSMYQYPKFTNVLLYYGISYRCTVWSSCTVIYIIGIKELLKWIHLYKKEYIRTMYNTILSQASYRWTYPIETKPFIFRKLRKGKSHFFSPELSKYYTGFTNKGKFHLYSTHKPLADTLCRGKVFSRVSKEEPNFTLDKNSLMSDVYVIFEEGMIIGPSVGPTTVLLPFVIALCNTYYNSELNIFNTTELYRDLYINLDRLPLVEGYINFTNEFNVLLSHRNLSCS